MSSVLLIECDGTRGWVSPSRAWKMHRDGIVSVESENPLVMREKPRIRIMRARFEENSRSARFLTSGGFALSLYRDDLRQALQMSAQGKPSCESATAREIAYAESERYVHSPHGEGR